MGCMWDVTIVLDDVSIDFPGCNTIGRRSTWLNVHNVQSYCQIIGSKQTSTTGIRSNVNQTARQTNSWSLYLPDENGDWCLVDVALVMSRGRRSKSKSRIAAQLNHMSEQVGGCVIHDEDTLDSASNTDNHSNTGCELFPESTNMAAGGQPWKSIGCGIHKGICF